MNNEEKILEILSQMQGEFREMQGEFREMQGELRTVNQRLGNLEQGQGIILHKLDVVSEQVASNTEKEYDVKVLSEKVNQLDIDVKIIKKAISN